MSRVIRRHSAGVLVAFALALSFTVTVLLADAPTAWTPELHMQVKRVSQVAVSPDGSRLAFVVGQAVMEGEKSEWLSHIHLAAADGSGSFQLTRGDKSATSPRWSPDGQWIGFISSRGGKANVWRIRPAGGEAEPITDEKGEVSSFEWSPDGASIAFVMRDPKTDEEEKADKEKRDWRTLDERIKMARLYIAPVEKNAEGKRPARKLTAGDYSVGAFSWSPDGRTIAFAHQPTPSPDHWTKSDISLASVADGQVTPLRNTGAAESEPLYSPDGRWIAFVASEDPPNWAGDERVHVVAATGGQPRALAETPDRQPNVFAWSADGSRIFITETQAVVSRVFAVPVDGGPAAPLEAGSVNISSASINRQTTTLGFVSQWNDRPAEAFAARMVGGGSGVAPTQVSKAQELPDLPLGRTEAIRWKAPDGMAVEGLLTYPAGYQPGTRVPLLVIVHGGPAGVFTQTFIGTASPYPIAAFAAQGYAVLRCNVRGSSGYGKTFRFANMGDWGGGDYRDIMSGVDRVMAMGVADPERLGVMGWSYGGFMTSWIVTQTKRFKAASAGAAVTNLMSFTGTADIPSFIPNYFGGEHWDVLDRWRAHSAMFNVKGATTPTLIQHGDADDRVPISQGYEFYNALKRQGVAVRMTVYPRQPHGFVEPKMTFDAARANIEWFARWVLKRETTSSPER